MNIKINGEAVAIDPGNISDLLVQRKVKMPDMVTVELNGQILNRDVFADTQLKDGDTVEFLYFMGGGASR
jgi:sulfur carrier protein